MLANAGLIVAVFTVKFESVAIGEAARVTFRVYVCVVPLVVTATFIVFGPTLTVIAPDAVPEATAVPFTVILAEGDAAVGVTFMVPVLLGTLTEYVNVVGENAGDNVPTLVVKAERLGLTRLAVKRPRPCVAAATV